MVQMKRLMPIQGIKIIDKIIYKIEFSPLPCFKYLKGLKKPIAIL